MASACKISSICASHIRKQLWLVSTRVENTSVDEGIKLTLQLKFLHKRGNHRQKSVLLISINKGNDIPFLDKSQLEFLISF